MVQAFMFPMAGEVPITPDPGTEAEWGEVITSQLIKSPPLMTFDN